MNKQDVLNQIHGGLIVSCQALEDEPLHSSYIMGRMAYAAFLGGAVGIRANSVSDIQSIKSMVSLPMIGIIKQKYEGYQVVITPTMTEIMALIQEKVEIIAMDATKRLRPGGVRLEDFFAQVRKRHPKQHFMADTARFEEGLLAQQLGFDFVGTTLSGYTPETKGRKLPDIDLMRRYVQELSVPIIAEGGITSPQQLQEVVNTGVLAAVVGSAITRPLFITQMYVEALSQCTSNAEV